jgi:hypothetical protein
MKPSGINRLPGSRCCRGWHVRCYHTEYGLISSGRGGACYFCLTLSLSLSSMSNDAVKLSVSLEKRKGKLNILKKTTLVSSVSCIVLGGLLDVKEQSLSGDHNTRPQSTSYASEQPLQNVGNQPSNVTSDAELCSSRSGSEGSVAGWL